MGDKKKSVSKKESASITFENNSKKAKTKLSKKDIKDISLSPNQKEYSEKIENNTITFCYGPAGSSKTYSACYTALKMLARGDIKKIIFTKPIQESGEKLGSLPGDVNEKISPFMESFLITLEKMISPEKILALINENIIQFKPIAYMRGATFDDSLMFLDEAQNCDMKQLMLYITRLGNNSKIIITGDVTQHDIAKNKVGLPTFIEIVKNIPDVAIFKFAENDIVRSKILKLIVKEYENWKEENLKR